MTLQLLWEPRDWWVGVYWNYSEAIGGDKLDIYICIIPLLPIKFQRYWPSLAHTKGERP